MLRRAVFIIIIIFISRISIAAGYNFSYTANCDKAYQSYLSLHIEEGNNYILQEIRSNPYNLMATYLSDYDDCLTLVFNCSKDDYEQRKNHYDERLSLLDKCDGKSPWYRLCKAGIYLHWAIIQLRFGNNLKAAYTFRKSYILLKENQERFPDFEYNKIFFGLEETVAGTIPDNYKWVASAFGLKGNIAKGIGLLNNFIAAHNANDPLYEEAIIYSAYLKFYLSAKQKEVWAYLSSKDFKIENNLLHAFVKANIAVNYRQAGEAVNTLSQAARSKYYAWYPIFDYEMGCALYNKLDGNCLNYFQAYLKNNKNALYVKDALQKMALASYLQKKMQQAGYYRNRIRQEGNDQLDADKQANRFGGQANWPNPIILKARLLIDGGYYTQALGELSAITVIALNASDLLEYKFRLGRIYEETGNLNKAIEYYLAAVNTGKDKPDQFGARAALQMGILYEHSNKPQNAKSMYNECLQMRHHDFQSSIDQQAKAGLNRISYN